MKSIHYPDGNFPRPYVFNSRDGDYTLYIFSFLLIVLVWCLIFRNYTPSTNTEFLVSCSSGDCATNIKTGEKRCPFSANTTVLADPTVEVCNPPESCASGVTPYSLNSDGSFNSTGKCESGQQCRCSTETKCPPFANVVFSINGNKFSQDYTISQIPANGSSSKNGNGNISSVATDSCYITLSDANRLTPGACNSSTFLNATSIIDCVSSNPCISGVLTFIPERTRDLYKQPFNLLNEGITTSMSCVPGKVCTSPSDIPIFDWKTGKSVCMEYIST